MTSRCHFPNGMQTATRQSMQKGTVLADVVRSKKSAKMPYGSIRCSVFLAAVVGPAVADRARHQ